MPSRVLVVDDHADTVEVLCVQLEVLGYEACGATNGPAAIAELERFQPNAMIVDLFMTGFDGFAVARAVRAHEAGRAIRLIALTGSSHAESRRRAREVGFDRFLLKPVTMAELTLVLA